MDSGASGDCRGADGGEVTTVLITRHRTGQETHKLNIESDMGGC